MGNGILEFSNKSDSNAQESESQCLTVNKARCPQNHPCPSLRVCPVDALTQKGFDAPTVDKSKCIKCGNCVKSCPMKALVLE